MKCFTFFQCQLQRGLQMTTFVPPNGSKVRGSPKEVLFLGQYGKKYENGPSNIARNVNLDKEGPAIVEECLEAGRIIVNPFNRNEPSFSQKTCRLVQNAYPRKIFKRKTEEFFVVLSNPLQVSNNILVRVNTSSLEDSTKRRGRWQRVSGRPSMAAHSRMVRETDGFVNVSSGDDIVVLHNQDIIKVITEGSESIDDQVIMNVDGNLVMTPAISFYMSGIEPEDIDAEDAEQELIEALSEDEFAEERSFDKVAVKLFYGSI